MQILMEVTSSSILNHYRELYYANQRGIPSLIQLVPAFSHLQAPHLTDHNGNYLQALAFILKLKQIVHMRV